ncbi:hypothetical protein AJ79_04268 [Helicocarpus griseus UAMH5409]|uniref:Methyltransferase n=1 Tax=Helicocarpus griseus UAMH5409 TaxID=1447875 RepID=A0A2B7XUY2_9EURO|nr:hypothetical protein AJ79_04268 [Helicocarpus griseus UAMH5409]
MSAAATEEQPTNPQVINVDDDVDSTVGDSDVSAYSASVTSSVLNYQYANGRRYNSYRNGEYLLPNDETEQDRLDIFHHVFLLLLDGKLVRAPVVKPQQVLDLGTGTGLWAMDYADENPSAQVIGTDLSPIQPSWVSPNVKFYVEDMEQDWAYDEAFDLIHMRQLGGSIKDWNKLLKQCYENLKPGAWVELQEPATWFSCDDDTMSKATASNEYQVLCNEAARKFGKEINVAHKLKQEAIDAGFVDVREEVMKVPIGPWAKDPKLKEIGRYFLELSTMGIEAYTLGFIGKILGWSQAECQVLAAKVKTELRNPRNHIYINTHFISGRKPN